MRKVWERIMIGIAIGILILLAVLLSCAVLLPQYQRVEIESSQVGKEDTSHISIESSDLTDSSTEETVESSSTLQETDTSGSAEETSLAEESKKAEEESKKAAEESKKAEEESKKAAEESKKAEEESKKAAEESKKAEEESKKAAEESKKAEEESQKAEEAQKAAVVSKTVGSKVSKAQVEASGTDTWFTVSKISDDVFSRMKGKSFGSDCTVSKDSLRYLRVLHYGRDGSIYVGELVCHKDIASSLSSIFRELYAHQYPIQKMRLVDDYGGDDIASAAANNSSCFNFRISAGDGGGLSRHALGKAIDINPLYNPYVWTDSEGKQRCDPSDGSSYVNRSDDYPYKMDADDFCVKLFKQYGFQWGGDWKYEKDYMHFSVS